MVFRYESLYLAGFGAIYLLAMDFRRPLRAARPLTLFLAPLVPVALALLVYNQTRFGSLGDTGDTAEIAFHFSWFSLYGLSFSPGQGLFTTSPFLLLGLLGVRPLYRRLSPVYFWLIAGSVLAVWLFYSAWFAWGGVWNWGPRFLLTVFGWNRRWDGDRFQRVFRGHRLQPGFCAELATLPGVGQLASLSVRWANRSGPGPRADWGAFDGIGLPPCPRRFFCCWPGWGWFTLCAVPGVLAGWGWLWGWRWLSCSPARHCEAIPASSRPDPTIRRMCRCSLR